MVCTTQSSIEWIYLPRDTHPLPHGFTSGQSRMVKKLPTIQLFVLFIMVIPSKKKGNFPAPAGYISRSNRIPWSSPIRIQIQLDLDRHPEPQQTNLQCSVLYPIVLCILQCCVFCSVVYCVSYKQKCTLSNYWSVYSFQCLLFSMITIIVYPDLQTLHTHQGEVKGANFHLEIPGVS